jgi:hypothetical protein
VILKPGFEQIQQRNYIKDQPSPGKPVLHQSDLDATRTRCAEAEEVLANLILKRPVKNPK